MKKSVRIQQSKMSLPTPEQEHKAKAQGCKCVAGIDEAGRGPIAGPVVAACVVLKSFDFTARIDDSKRLSALLREQAYAEILKKAYVGIGIVSEDTIKSVNIANATALAMCYALYDLPVKPDLLLIDGIMGLKVKQKQICIIKGDQKSISIAAASIIAKVTRDKLMVFYDELFPDYGLGVHKGYGTRMHFEAIDKFGLSPLHRGWRR